MSDEPHLLVREDTSGELVGCYRMLPPPGAIAAASNRVNAAQPINRTKKAKAMA